MERHSLAIKASATTRGFATTLNVVTTPKQPAEFIIRWTSEEGWLDQATDLLCSEI
jgi:hypothetical protein